MIACDNENVGFSFYWRSSFLSFFPFRATLYRCAMHPIHALQKYAFDLSLYLQLTLRPVMIFWDDLFWLTVPRWGVVPLLVCWIDFRDKIQGELVLPNLQGTASQSMTFHQSKVNLVCLHYATFFCLKRGKLFWLTRILRNGQVKLLDANGSNFPSFPFSTVVQLDEYMLSSSPQTQIYSSALKT